MACTELCVERDLWDLGAACGAGPTSLREGRLLLRGLGGMPTHQWTPTCGASAHHSAHLRQTSLLSCSSVPGRGAQMRRGGRKRLFQVVLDGWRKSTGCHGQCLGVMGRLGTARQSQSWEENGTTVPETAKMSPRVALMGHQRRQKEVALGGAVRGGGWEGGGSLGRACWALNSILSAMGSCRWALGSATTGSD